MEKLSKEVEILKYPYEIQKHIPQKHLFGSVFLNKKVMADFADLIRCSPSAARVLILFMAYADDRNSIITDVKTVAKLLGLDIKTAKYALRKLIKNGYISMTEVKLNHNRRLIGVQHDKQKYYKSDYTEWQVIGETLICDFTLTGTYNRFIINKNIVKCFDDNGSSNNLVKYIKGPLFYQAVIYILLAKPMGL